MNDKTKRILAIIALVFMGVFTVAFVAFLINPKMLGGVVAFVALFSGVIGVGLFFVIKTFSKKGEEEPDNPCEPEEENDGEENGETGGEHEAADDGEKSTEESGG